MTGSKGLRAQVMLACLLATAVVVVVPRHASGQETVADKRAEAAALRERIAQQGRKLSLADEEFNQARIARQRIESQANSAQDAVAASEDRWNELKDQLAQRVRLMYMHPGAQLDAWMGTSSVAELARKQKFGSEVLAADTELVMATERARQDVLARAKRLDGIRDAAAAKESELASRRAEVNDAVAAQRALLGRVNGEIAGIMEEQRQAEVAAARAAQPEQGPAATSAPPAIGDDRPDTPSRTPGPSPTAEPVGPAPPVKGGAGKAVATAAAQIGKPYEWAADGPDSFDCSGLTMYAWSAAGVSLPHSSRAQYASLPHVARSQLRPGDLVFFGSPIHHVGIYEGGGTMINAPQTGELVRRDSIARADYAGAARP